METVANSGASESGSEMLMALASSTLAILLAKFIWKEICPLAILLAKFIWTNIWPLAILVVKGIIKLSCALTGLAACILHRIFEHTGPMRAGAATVGAENNVELHERDGGIAPGRAHSVDV